MFLFEALDNVIAEDDEFVDEDYYDVDEYLQGQILGKATNGKQEAQPISEEDSGMLSLYNLVFKIF